MKLTFDYYHNLEQVDLCLCNPDGRELFPLPGKSRNLTLRFNDLSELTFEVDSKITLSDNTIVDLEAYDYVQTKRLVYATNIGWFQISGVDEHDNGVVKYKSVTAESYQSVLKNKGFISEERVYCFYNPNDPHDDHYDSTKEDSIPSVVGQWSKQLGIKLALDQGASDPSVPYDDWTVTYIHSSLIYEGAGSKCRTFKENVTYGYDWMVNDVEEAFEVVVLFDFMYKTIHVMTPAEITQRVNVIYTFNNFMKNVDINENAEDIVTVLNCSGDNCDITAVNPMGTNYICDFSYYMDKTNYRWMSRELITKLEAWKAACDAEKTAYTNYISQLRSLWLQKTQCMKSLQEMSLFLQDLKNAQIKRSIIGSGAQGELCGIITAESVQVGKTSIKNGTDYYSTAFTVNNTIRAYQSPPSYNAKTKKWVFSGASKSATVNYIISRNFQSSDPNWDTYWYFSDAADGSSYCKLHVAAKIDKDSGESTYYCDGFERFIAYTYPIIEKETGVTTYTDTIQEWINLREGLVNSLNATDALLKVEIDTVSNSLDEISKSLNIISYFASTPALLRELNCYWIEGDYTNDNIAVLEETTAEEEIDLSNELLDAGYIELSKICQPRFSFSLESIDATKQYEFRDQMRLLELGKIITIEKEEGLWYYPALLEISMNLDNSDEFSMTFANAIRLDDWGYTYADLISDASSTSRKVSANWQNILAYSKERAEISSLIKDPLDVTLRASFANMVNQEFAVDKNGILGRKKVSEASDEFENEQVRLINNLLIFTDDNWETAKTALGKIYYTDDAGNEATSYGLIAETIIGSLIMGERLKIKNQQSTVELGADGIAIKKSDGTVVFSAKPDGSLVVHNYANQSSVDSLSERMSAAEFSIDANTGQIALKASQSSVDSLSARMSTAEARLDVQATNISAKVSSSYANENNDFGWSLTPAGFYVNSGGINVISVTKNLVEISGKITATSGEIGGWTIANGKLYAGDGSEIGADDKLIGTAAIQAPTSSSGWVFAAGGTKHSSYSDCPFRVYKDGSMYATSATITGNITANSGWIKGKLQFGGNKNYFLDANNSNASWYIYLPGLRVDDDGAVFHNGLISGVEIGNTTTRGKGCIIKHYDGGGTSGIYGFNIGLNDGNNTMYLQMGETTQGDRIWLNSGRYINIISNDKTSSCTYIKTKNIVLGLTDTGDPSTAGALYGNWTLKDSGAAVTSDIKLKKDILNIEDIYEGFYDKLRPVTFRYKNGTSGRLHTGFIAQEVEEALAKSNIDTNCFAGIVIQQDVYDPDAPSNTEQSSTYYLRYEEFISLNTWQIQKLKTRVAELEAIVAKLQETNDETY